MSELKKGQRVKARTMRGTREVAGTITEVSAASNGKWVTIKPDNKDEKPFMTRPGCVTLA
ncbi:hypothetical protein [Acidovorax sp. SDU_ACID1]|uniref:hypothetical protein n=1 Tax=Acidovorax sp. SDU_ACID1 TaxID=3136632 RepID=UPI003872E54C